MSLRPVGPEFRLQLSLGLLFLEDKAHALRGGCVSKIGELNDFEILRFALDDSRIFRCAQNDNGTFRRVIGENGSSC